MSGSSTGSARTTIGVPSSTTVPSTTTIQRLAAVIDRAYVGLRSPAIADPDCPIGHGTRPGRRIGRSGGITERSAGIG